MKRTWPLPFWSFVRISSRKRDSRVGMGVWAQSSLRCIFPGLEEFYIGIAGNMYVRGPLKRRGSLGGCQVGEIIDAQQ